jgi:hypothetical protein
MKAMMLLVLGLSVAHAAEPTGTLTLACEGTKSSSDYSDAKRPVSMGMNLDFKARTVDSLRISANCDLRSDRDDHHLP